MATEKTNQELLEDLNDIQDTLSSSTNQEQILKMMESLTTTTQEILANHTTAPDIKQKLKSRKFWIAIIGVLGGICGMLNSGGNVTAIIIFVMLEACSILGYFFAEGNIDSTRTKEMIQAATQIAQILGTISPMLEASSTEVQEASTSEEPTEESVEPEVTMQNYTADNMEALAEVIIESQQEKLHDAATEAAYGE